MFVNFYKSIALALAITSVSAVHLETEEDTALAGFDDFSYGLAEIYNENKPAAPAADSSAVKQAASAKVAAAAAKAVAPAGAPKSADVKKVV
jgi:hypothetical protein